MILAWTLDVPETLIKANADLRPVPQEYFLFVGIHLAIATVGLLTRRYLVQLVLPIIWFSVTVYYVVMSSLGRLSA